MVLYQIKKGSVLVWNAKIKYMGRPLTKMSVQRLDVIGLKSYKISSSRPVKSCSEPFKLSLTPKDVSTMLKRVYVSLKLLPIRDIWPCLIFARFLRTSLSKCSGAKCPYVRLP
jgi:hypothetical protein